MSITETVYESFMKGDITLFYRHMYADMLLYARSVLQTNLEFLAEDCVQSSVEKTYNSRSRFTSAGQWKGFLLTCIRNHAVSLIRHQTAADRYADYFNLQPQEKEDILLDYIRQETLTRLYDAIDALPEDLRDLLRLSFVEGLKNAEIAQRLGVAEITIKKRKARLLTLLRSRLGNETFILLMLLGV